MREAWTIAALGNRLGNDVLLADVALRNALDADTRGFRNLRCVVAEPVAQLCRKPRIIENPDAVRIEVRCDALRMANAGCRARDNDPVVAGKKPSYPLIVAFDKSPRHRPLANRPRPALL